MGCDQMGYINLADGGCTSAITEYVSGERLWILDGPLEERNYNFFRYIVVVVSTSIVKWGIKQWQYWFVAIYLINLVE